MKSSQEDSQTSSNTIFKDDIPLTCRFAIFSSPANEYSNWFDSLLLLFEYGQLIAQGLIVNRLIFQDQENSGHNYLHEMATAIFGALSPGHFLSFHGGNDSGFIVLILVFILASIRIMILFYCIMTAKNQKRGHPVLIKLWKWNFVTQARFVCLFSISTWSYAAYCTLNNLTTLSEAQNLTLQVVSIFMASAEFIITFGLCAYFDCIIPRKSLLALKTTKITLLTVTQKFIIEMILALYTADLRVLAWIVSSLNLFFSFLRASLYFKLLPPYKLKTLFIKAVIIMIAAGLHISAFVKCIIDAAGYHNKNLNFIIILWVTLAVLMAWLAIGSLNHVILNFATKWQDQSPERLINKMILVKQILKQNKLPDELVKKYQQIYLVNTTTMQCFGDIFHIDTQNIIENDDGSLHKKALLNKLFLIYLQDILEKYPSSEFAKLYAAYFYGSKAKLFSWSMKILLELRQSQSMQMRNNAAILIDYLEDLVKKNYKQKESLLDLNAYHISLTEYHYLKQAIVQQAKLHINIYQENLGDCNLGKILTLAQQTSQQRTLIEKKFISVIQKIPEHFTQPLLLYAQYNLVLNHSLADYFKYTKIYSQRVEKYKDSFNTEEILRENVHDKNSICMVVSGQKNDTGRVIYCSKSFQRKLGTSIIGQHSSISVPPVCRSYYVNFLKACFEMENTTTTLNKFAFDLGMDKDGFLFPMHFYINMTPILFQGLNYSVILRFVETSKDYILITKDGNIENYSRKIARKLRLPYGKQSQSKTSIHVNQISSEITAVNKAFNLLDHHPESDKNANFAQSDILSSFRDVPLVKHSSSTKKTAASIKFPDLLSLKNRNSSRTKTELEIDIEKARALTSLFTNEGKEILMKSFSKNSASSSRAFTEDNEGGFSYHCKIQDLPHVSCRLLVLQENVSQEYNSTTILQKNSPPPVLQNETPPPQEFSFDQTQQQTPVKKVLKYKNSNSANSSEFFTEEEKEGGWADFNSLTLQKSCSASPLKETTKSKFSFYQTINNNNQMDDMLASTTERVLLANHTTRGPLNDESMILKVPPVVQINVENQDKQTLATDKSKFFIEEKISKAYINAVTTKFYSKSYKSLLALVYLMFIGVLVSLLYLVITLNNDLDLLRGRKEVIKSMEIQNVLLSNVHRNFRILSMYASGEYSQADFAVSSQAPTLLAISTQILTQSSVFNNNLLDSIRWLNEEDRDLLFDVYLKFYNTNFEDPQPSFTSLTILQSLQRIISTCYKVINDAPYNLASTLPDLNIFLRNTLNDYSIANQNMIQVILNASTSRKDDVFRIIDNCWIGTSLTMGALGVIFIVVIIKQYKRERKHLTAFAMLNLKRIKKIKEKVLAFQGMIEDEVDLELIQNIESTEKYRLGSSSNNLPAKSAETPSDPKFTRVILRYFSYIIYLVFAIFLALGLLTVGFTQSKSLINTLNEQLFQLMFAGRIVNRANIALAVPVELIAKNDSTLLENVAPSVEIVNVINELEDSRKEIFANFSPYSSSVIDGIKELLYDDGCGFLDANFLPACQQLKLGLGNGYSGGLVQFISYLASFLKDIKNEYDDSDKTASSLKALYIDLINAKLPKYLLVGQMSRILVQKIDWEYENDFKNGRIENGIMNGVIYLMMVIVCVGLYFGALKRFGEAANNFKKVLRVFPSSLILSNFVLKSYLLQTSHGALDSVLNKI